MTVLSAPPTEYGSFSGALPANPQNGFNAGGGVTPDGNDAVWPTFGTGAVAYRTFGILSSIPATCPITKVELVVIGHGNGSAITFTAYPVSNGGATLFGYDITTGTGTSNETWTIDVTSDIGTTRGNLADNGTSGLRLSLFGRAPFIKRSRIRRQSFTASA